MKKSLWDQFWELLLLAMPFSLGLCLWHVSSESSDMTLFGGWAVWTFTSLSITLNLLAIKILLLSEFGCGSIFSIIKLGISGFLIYHFATHSDIGPAHVFLSAFFAEGLTSNILFGLALGAIIGLFGGIAPSPTRGILVIFKD